jgi:DNA-binding LacI/PurR family transcriptional regulator
MAVTIRDVAKRSATSVASVSYVLSGRTGGSIRVGEGARERILAAAQELGFSPNPIARSLATGRTRSLGLVFPYADAFIDQNPFCVHVMNGVLKAVIEENYNVMLFTARMSDHEGVVHALDGLHRVDGILLVCPDLNGPVVEACQTRKIPGVAVVSPMIPGFHTVNADDETGGYIGTKHLLDLGHRRIGFLAGSETISTSAMRHAGYVRAMNESGFGVDPELVVQSSFNSRSGLDAMQKLLGLSEERRPTAVLACNDLCASGAILAIQSAGLHVPDDIAVVGYDDTEFCQTIRPTLTSVRMCIDELGVAAVKRLVAILDDQPYEGTDVVLPVSLATRQSSGVLRRDNRAQNDGVLARIQ